MTTLIGQDIGGVTWHREGSVKNDNLRYVGELYQPGGHYSHRGAIVIESMESALRGKRVYEVRLFGGMVVSVKPSLSGAKKVAVNHLRWALDKMGWGLAGHRPGDKRAK